MNFIKVFALACCLIPFASIQSLAKDDARKLIETEFYGCDFELLHLDQLLLELQNQPKVRGYIIVYAPSVGSKSGAALAYGARMKKYLVVARALKSVRITVVDGGFREKLSYEMWLVPEGTELPVARPTVSRKDVKLKRGKTKLYSCDKILG
ncbi:MAG TPA: hypothetical protein VF666_03150 [Pyrinomonadaceae bacterium]|jgi:hypothetical protein